MVQEAGAATPLLSSHAGTPMNPASVMKLVTTFAGLELLGPTFQWKTEVYRETQGNRIFIRGYGDPKLNLESFWMMLRALRARGVHEIGGDIVLDRSYFGPVDEELIDDEAFRPYNVVPDALLVNFRSLHFDFIPDGPEGAVTVLAQPALPGLQIVNGLKRAGGACPRGRAFRDLVQAEFRSRPPLASFTGRYPASCGERSMDVALYQPEDYVAAMIGQLWAELGGTWKGKVREGTVPPGARLVYVHASEPLARAVRDINKFSNNVMARQLFLTLGAELGGPPARTQTASAAVRLWLAGKGIGAPGLALDNGSGLSREGRISAATLAALLQAAWRSPVMPELLASLPVVADEGSMFNGLQGEGVAGNAHVKTGLLNDVLSMAGFVLDRSGRRYVVVMFINDPRATRAQAALDALLEWVYEGPSARELARALRGPGRPTARRRDVSLQRP
jgi:D-alanyl-D-alanine carboxypeptidase/D-alanyl-D-alanine-endopeptidase (penicillin-binding protein 4)